MIQTLRALAGLVILSVLVACGAPDSRFKTYSGPPVTQVIVSKSQRQMHLLSGSMVLKSYDVSLGNQPVGHKMFEGDGRTPEGVYYIDRKNPNSRYHLSVGISYPNALDTQVAQSFGQSAGSDIFIHGRGPEGRSLIRQRRDWTAGCIAVRDDEIEDIYSMLQPGVPIVIQP